MDDMNQTASSKDAIRTVNSRAYGSFQVTESQIYHFPRGLIGLHEFKDFALIQVDDGPFHILHALNDELSFILLPAHLGAENYGFQIDRPTVELLAIRQPEDVNTFLIVNAIDDELFVNLKAPVLAAPGSRRGCQFVIDDPAYPIRHPLIRKEGS
jgi:flagellar assembly factor FliW